VHAFGDIVFVFQTPNMTYLKKSDHTPLHLCFTPSLQLEAATVLLERGADLTARDEVSQLYIHIHICNCHIISLRLSLLAPPPPPPLIQGGDTPLHVAALEGFLEGIRFLVEKGADIHALNKVV
jgi:ankyrin repeat protein